MPKISSLKTILRRSGAGSKQRPCDGDEGDSRGKGAAEVGKTSKASEETASSAGGDGSLKSLLGRSSEGSGRSGLADADSHHEEPEHEEPEHDEPAAAGPEEGGTGGGTGGGRPPPVPPPLPPLNGRGESGPPPLSHSLTKEGPLVDLSYESLPLLDVVELPRGGVSVETSAVGHVQFGIPPETIKDSMRLGIPVPSVYIVPVDRFCRDMGPALGVNLAEFEFPAYFNYFVQRKRCTLIVDSVDAERNIRRVFSETLLGPAQFRRDDRPLRYEEEDFAPDFPREAIPDFQKELQHFRVMPDGKELVLETLLDFCHFESAPDSNFRDNLGAPPLPQPSADRPPPGDEGDGPSDGAYDRDSVASNGPLGGGAPVTENGMRKKAPRALTYSQIRWIGDVAKVYPSGATEEQIAQNQTKRVEIFKMPSGTDYVLHDIDENNCITGKARFSGHVRVSEGISVIGLDDDHDDATSAAEDSSHGGSVPLLPPTFCPPSFGVTVLGNSHGFDKSGSTSGYVLWINGRGVMIDPPPYSSATLEREGIRPRTIVGIILTHCHADHDAGAFQKVLTGSPVVVITTPTIYKSFIRKYAALSSLSPALLRHSHRYKPAIIGEPLRFQGATFNFTYTLHAIPCVGFRVDWRGRSMVFTGDHFNNPPALEKLMEKGIMSKARLADLNHLPLQQADLLLHEAGAPPIHTPLSVLEKLPEEVKRRMYVVHTSALPEGCELRVAPTGTAGTIRLDQIKRGSGMSIGSGGQRPSIFESGSGSLPSLLALSGGVRHSLLDEVDEYAESELLNPTPNAYAHLLGKDETVLPLRPSEPPPVSLRPTSSSDAWFILNLLSAVPFLSSLSYTSTMEVLEAARVVAYGCDNVVLAANRRSKYLVVVWEGTCVERSRVPVPHNDSMRSVYSEDGPKRAVWYAGDWTGPRTLQPEKRLSGDSSTSDTHDVVAMSREGVKVIKVDFTNLHAILRNGSSLYRKYHMSLSQQHTCNIPNTISPGTAAVFKNAVKNLNVIELLESNTGLRKLTAVQKRHLECLVEGPMVYIPGQRLWRAGSTVEKAFIVVAGTVSFVPKRRHGGSAGKLLNQQTRVRQTRETNASHAIEGDGNQSIGETMRHDAVKAVRELQASVNSDMTIGNHSEEVEDVDYDGESKSLSGANSMTETEEYARLSKGLRKWAERHESQSEREKRRRGSESTDASPEVSLHDLCDSITMNADEMNRIPGTPTARLESADRTDDNSNNRRTKDRFANKVLGRLYNRRAFASGLVFSKGHFLGDIEKMVEGLLSSAHTDASRMDGEEDDLRQFSFGEADDALSLDTMTIHELEGGQHTAHSSTLAAGKDGCVVLVLPKASLILFLDSYPGLLLSLLGTQVVV